MAHHEGRVVATDQRSYALRSCAGTLTVDDDRLVIQGSPLATGHPRRPVVIERADVGTLRLRCGLFGARLERVTAAGYRSDVIRVRGAGPLAADLQAHAWPVELTGPRRPR